MRDDETNETEAFAVRVAAPLRAPERVDATFTARVMADVHTVAADRPAHRPARETPRALGSPTHADRPRPWWRRPVTLRITPLAALALAASVAGVVLLGNTVLRRAARRPSPERVATDESRTAPSAIRHDTTYVVRFVLIAPSASSVALVGDFNHWNRNVTPLVPTGRHGVWTVSVALPPGRHEYAFITDGAHWTADPHAALTVADDFGTESSIVTVGTRGAPRTL